MLRRRRRAEGGQALIMALAVIAFFGLVTTSVLQLTGTVELEQTNVSSTASRNAASEGGALFAAADAVHAGLGWPFTLGSCVAGSQAKVSMNNVSMTGETVSYATESCNPGSTAKLLAEQCAVCVLSTSQASQLDEPLKAYGPISFNAQPTCHGPGGRTSLMPLASGSVNSGFIAGPSSQMCNDSPAAQPLTTPITDPLSSASVPSGAAGAGTGPCKPDPAVEPAEYPNNTIPSGLYCSITLSSGNWTLSGGTYSILSALAVGGSASVSGSGVQLYFTCAQELNVNYVGACANGDSDGGILDFSSSGSIQLTPPSPGGVVMFVDRRESRVSDTVPQTSCHDPNAVVCVDGEGSVQLGGTLYTESGQMDVLDGATDVCPPGPSCSPAPTGDLVVSSLDLQGGVGINVAGMVPIKGYCWVYDDTTKVTKGSTTLGQAHVIVQVNCPDATGGTASGIVDVNYGP